MAEMSLQGSHGEMLRVVVRAYEREGSDDVYDANWLLCSAFVDTLSFRGTIEASLLTFDFSKFLDDLEEVMASSRGVANFDTMEGALDMRIELNQLGHVLVSGQMHEMSAGETKLTFAFTSERSFLVSAHADLKTIVAKFPERTIADKGGN